jgi:hypothetical protein
MRTCVVCGSVDGRFLVWWVIDNMVWTDSWLSIAGAGCGLTVVGAGENKCERSLSVRPLGVEKTSRLGSRDLVDSGVKWGPHGGNNSKTKSWTVSWLSLKTKVKTGLRGSRVLSGDRRRLHQVRRVSRKSLGFLVDPKSQGRRPEAAALDWFDRCATTHSETSKRRTRVGIARLALRLSKFAVASHSSDGATTKFPKMPFGGVYPSCDNTPRKIPYYCLNQSTLVIKQ